MNVQRFESWPGSQALIDAVWSVRAVRSTAVMTCRSVVSEPVGGGYDALVEGHRRAFADFRTDCGGRPGHGGGQCCAGGERHFGQGDQRSRAGLSCCRCNKSGGWQLKGIRRPTEPQRRHRAAFEQHTQSRRAAHPDRVQ